MADPRNELADVVVPLAPEIPAAVGAWPSSLPMLALAALASVGLAAWLWRRTRSSRALRRLAADVAQRRADAAELAGRLDAWVRARYRLQRVDAAAAPAGIAPAAWAGWAEGLNRVRFAAPQPDAYEQLASLCETARSWRRGA
jgi:hypothetical protein